MNKEEKNISDAAEAKAPGNLSEEDLDKVAGGGINPAWSNVGFRNAGPAGTTFTINTK